MKKIIMLVAFLFLLSLTYSFYPVFYKITTLHNVMFSIAEYSVYCLDYCGLNSKDITIVDNGNSYIVKSSINNAKSIKENSYSVLGESIKFKSNLLAIDKILSAYNIKVKIKENINDILIIYGETDNNNFSNSILVDDNVINVQLAFKDNILTIGSPIILGDY